MVMKTFKWYPDHEEKIKDFFFGDFCTKYIFKRRNQPPSLTNSFILTYQLNFDLVSFAKENFKEKEIY